MKAPTLEEAKYIVMMMKLTDYPYPFAKEMMENYVRVLQGEPQQGWGWINPEGSHLLAPPCIERSRTHGRYTANRLWIGLSSNNPEHLKNHKHLLPDSYKRRHKWHKRKRSA